MFRMMRKFYINQFKKFKGSIDIRNKEKLEKIENRAIENIIKRIIAK
jgi:hypothetical protein